MGHTFYKDLITTKNSLKKYFGIHAQVVVFLKTTIVKTVLLNIS